MGGAIHYCYDQGIGRRIVDLNELFAPNALDPFSKESIDAVPDTPELAAMGSVRGRLIVWFPLP